MPKSSDATLETFYNARVATLGQQDFLRQVGHTERGAPITPQQFAIMTGQLQDLLDLRPDDTLLDLCCGNGVVTAPLAARVAATAGVDLSGELIAVAKAHHGSANTDYLQGDLLKLPDLPGLAGRQFSKILLQGGLQHFDPDVLEPLMKAILTRATPGAVIVFGFVPEQGKQRHLFNTPRRKLHRLYLRATGRDRFGHWWDKRALTAACAKLGLTCSFHAIDDRLQAASYRFNMRITAL